MNNGTFLLMYRITNNKDITRVGPVDMQYMCPLGLGIAVGNIVITRDIPYKE